MRSKKLFVPLVFVIMILVGGLTARLSNQQQPEFTPCIIVWKVTDYDSNGTATPVYTETRWKSSDGRWRDIKLEPDGTVIETVAEPGRGVFQVSPDQLHFVSTYQKAPGRLSREDYMNSSQYARIEIVKDLECVVLTPSPGTEFYVAPSLGGEIIKTVMLFGGQLRVIEPVSIEFAEPDPANLVYTQLPVSYEHYNNLHGGR
ncbi:MAG TPA: hypothetical protein VF131_28010 [Blastocatellia bacterium]|nr:hypothetical protein [Blastocatellia bacterium]